MHANQETNLTGMKVQKSTQNITPLAGVYFVPKMNVLNLKSLLLTGQFKSGVSYDFDCDNKFSNTRNTMLNVLTNTNLALAECQQITTIFYANEEQHSSKNVKYGKLFIQR